MKRIIYHVKPRQGDLWEARREKRSRATFISPSKEEAVRRISEQMKDKFAQVIVHGTDGSVEAEHVYPPAM